MTVYFQLTNWLTIYMKPAYFLASGLISGLNMWVKKAFFEGKRKESHFCNSLISSGATSNRKLVCMALFLNKLYLYHDVSPLNKIFTALHRSTSVCILGTISECKDTTNIRISNIILLFVL